MGLSRPKRSSTDVVRPHARPDVGRHEPFWAPQPPVLVAYLGFYRNSQGFSVFSLLEEARSYYMWLLVNLCSQELQFGQHGRPDLASWRRYKAFPLYVSIFNYVRACAAHPGAMRTRPGCTRDGREPADATSGPVDGFSPTAIGWVTRTQVLSTRNWPKRPRQHGQLDFRIDNRVQIHDFFEGVGIRSTQKRHALLNAVIT